MLGECPSHEVPGPLRICVIAVGKVKDKGLRELIDDYARRIRRHVPFDELEVREGKNEGQAICQAIPSGAHVVALEVDGKALDSVELATSLASWGACGKGVVAFLIGGADGLPRKVSAGAHMRLSLSRLTLAHRIARVVLIEQIYRATTIWRGEPYHR